MEVRLATLYRPVRTRFAGLLRLPPRRLVPWVAGAAAVVVAGTVGAVLLAAGGGSAQPAAKATTRVQRGTVTSTVSAAGGVQSLASRGLNFSMSGTITELNVTAGDTVGAGAVLARIDSAEAQQAVDEAATQVENAEEAVTRARSSSSSSPSTRSAAANAALADAAVPLAESTIPLAEPTAGFRVAAAMDCPASSASAQPSGSAAASPSPSTSPSGPCAPCACSTQPGNPTQPATQPQTGNPAQNGTSPQNGNPPQNGNAPQNGNGARNGTQPQNGSGGAAGPGQGAGNGGGSAAATDSLFSAEEQLNNARLTLKQAQARLAGTTITAPVAGMVLSVGGVLGGSATVTSSGFIVLAGTNDVAVRAQFTEAEIARLATGQDVEITLPDRAGETFTGSVLQIDPAGTVSNKLVRYAALMTFDQAPQGLLYGQTANVAVITSAVENVLLVPATAVFDRTGQTGTVTVRSRGRDVRRTVRTGLRGDVSTEIRDGLAEGETVLTAGR